MDNFSERLIELLDKTGISRRKLASELGISERMIQYYITGTKGPTLEMLISIANYFGVSIDYLVGQTNPESVAQKPPTENIDDQLREVMSDPYAMAMFNDFPSASEEDKQMLLEIWKSIKNRSKEKGLGKEE